MVDKTVICCGYGINFDTIPCSRVQRGSYIFFFQAEDGIRDYKVTGVQTCALPISVGIAVRRGASLHGCALNVNIDLRPFAFIVPCGLTDRGVTSLEQESEGPVPLPDRKSVV